jgi:hypothetical protein
LRNNDGSVTFEGRRFSSVCAASKNQMPPRRKVFDLILKGAKLPICHPSCPTRFELAINLKAAKALGLTFPQILLADTALDLRTMVTAICERIAWRGSLHAIVRCYSTEMIETHD